MSMIKYRIHEVAKDFNVTSKVISQILTICRFLKPMSWMLYSSI